MKTIVITGSAGLIGSHLCYKFLELGYIVVGVDNLIGGYASNMPEQNKSFYYYNIDILNTKRLSEIFKFHKPEAVIHCAALAHEGLSVFAPKTIVENIYAGTASVASAACANDVATFINTSSMARYGAQNPPFIEDETIPTPIDPYGLAKLHAEQHLKLMSDIHGIKVITMVPHNVCGPHQCYSDPFRNVMSIFANQLKRNKPIYIYGDGSQKRSFSHVTDCVDAYVTAYNSRDSIGSGEVFNIGPDDGTEITVKELAVKVSRYFNVDPNITHLPERPREVKDAWVSTTKAKTVLNYATNNSTDETIADTVNWMRTQPNRDFKYHLDLEIITPSTPKTWTDKLFNA
jgi:UDP-glucose 4-epimerase